VPAEDWSCLVPDATYRTVRLYGKLSHPADPQATADGSELLILVHGLGGSAESGYMRYAAKVARAAGLSCLRLNQRGADLQGEDYYHAGLWQDLNCVVSDAAFARFDAIYLLGYSIGGQLCLHWAAKGNLGASRVRAVAAVCAPLDLAPASAHLDGLGSSIYRAHILKGLKRAYSAVAARRAVPVPVPIAKRITLMHEWDDRVTAPRHAFQSADHYYAQASAQQCLRDITCPTLMVVAEHDPMVPISTLTPVLDDLPRCMLVKRLARGGHVGFPQNVSLGQPGPLGLEPQIITWLSGTHR